MNNNNKIVDTCQLLGNYIGENIYLYSCKMMNVLKLNLQIYQLIL